MRDLHRSFSEEQQKREGKKTPTKIVHSGLQAKDLSLYFRLIFSYFFVMNCISVEFAAIIF